MEIDSKGAGGAVARASMLDALSLYSTVRRTYKIQCMQYICIKL